MSQNFHDNFDPFLSSSEEEKKSKIDPSTMTCLNILCCIQFQMRKFNIQETNQPIFFLVQFFSYKNLSISTKKSKTTGAR